MQIQKQTERKVLMLYHNIEFPTTQPLSPICFDLNSLYDYFSRLTGKRKARGKRYPLAAILVMTLLAKLAGQDQPQASLIGSPCANPSSSRLWLLGATALLTRSPFRAFSATPSRSKNSLWRCSNFSLQGSRLASSPPSRWMAK